MQSEQLVSRKALAARWQCSIETIKRRTAEGILHPVRFNQRMIRYPLSEVIRIENEGRGMPLQHRIKTVDLGLRPHLPGAYQ
jgi:hypothetical protein